MKISSWVKAGFGITAGSVAYYALALILLLLGWVIMDRYNKPGTKLFSELQGGQYVGLLIGAVGALMAAEYFLFPVVRGIVNEF